MLRSPSRRSPEVLIPFVGLIYIVLSFLYLDLQAGPAAAVSGFGIIILVFALIYLASAVLVWRRSRIGYLASIIMSVIFIGAFGSGAAGALTGFADLSSFLAVITILPVLGVVLVYSILGVRLVWRKNAMPRQGRTIPASTFLALVVVGFIIGGASVGIVASGVVTSLVKSSGLKADIVIIPGAANSGTVMPFTPGTFTVKVGTTVTWGNNDTATHTVTSTSVPSGASSFDSGNLPYGTKFSVTFTVPGTYRYDCSIHPSMTGTIVVTSS